MILAAPAGCALPSSPAVAEGQADAGAELPPLPPAAVSGESGAPAPSTAPAAAAAPAAARASDPTIPWIVAGGGSLPEHNQVSIEQDLALAAEILGEVAGRGLVLFAGGPGAAVQVQRAEDEASVGDPVALALADLFAPRGGRGAIYRPTTLAVDGPASADAVKEALRAALAGPGEGPLLLYVAGHGEIGEGPRDNRVDLWAQSALRVGELAELLDEGERPVTVVVTTCFSGGFGELVFAGADPARGPAPTPRCGLFASTWDLEASGCDPNPDRRAQEGYGLHFLHALRGQDRDGAALEGALVDLDGDGRISLLEAHTRARIAGRGLDVPTTTSERWLREAAPAEGPTAALSLPEEEAVIAALARELGLDEPERAADVLAGLEAEIDDAREALADAEAAEDAAYRRAAAALLARWPVADDPWHPDFKDMYDRSKAAIAEHLAADPDYLAYLGARAEVDRWQGRIGDLRGDAARYERLGRAVETRALAGRLAHQGGPAWERYQGLLACERGLPGAPAAAPVLP